MNINFEAVLFYATVLTGLIALVDVLFFAKQRKAKHPHKPLPMIFDYSRSFFPVLLIVFVFRSFVFEPFRIPSGSLEPTLLMGDFILVNKYDYGIRLPLLHKKIIDDHMPKHGDIMVFRWPAGPSYNFIKRVIGLPGDHVSYIDKKIYINGVLMPQTFIQKNTAQDESGNHWTVDEYQEDLLGVKHDIYLTQGKASRNYINVTVPQGMYFVMGDNRDDSADSRYWGFVPERAIIGKAMFVWLSWGGLDHGIRWNRFGQSIH